MSVYVVPYKYVIKIFSYPAPPDTPYPGIIDLERMYNILAKITDGLEPLKGIFERHVVAQVR